jgi:hypothetical protein
MGELDLAVAQLVSSDGDLVAELQFEAACPAIVSDWLVFQVVLQVRLRRLEITT